MNRAPTAVRLSLGVALALLFTGCPSHPGVEMTIYNPSSGAQPRDPAAVKLLSGDDRPDCEFDEIGTIAVTKAANHNGTDEMLAYMREKVGEAAGDGVIHLETGRPGTVGEGNWSGTIYRCKS